jgi:hypothetical protein
MRILVISDVHGRNNWGRVEREDYDKVVFLGDYFDSFDIPFGQQLNNFRNIIAYKLLNKNKVTLLIGNHCYHYLEGEIYSGYQTHHAHQIREIYTKYLHLFDIAYEKDNYLFSHAGVSNSWLNKVDENAELRNEYSLVDTLNLLWATKPRVYSFEQGYKYDRTFNTQGNAPSHSPIWIRPNSLVRNSVEGYIHVVGHTQVRNPHLEANKQVLLTDCPHKYIIIDTDERLFYSYSY